MSCLVAIDPGLRAAGLAVFRGGQLAAATLVRCDDGEDVDQWRHMAAALLAATPDDVGALALEEMKYRESKARTGESKAGKDAAVVPRILALAYVTGLYAGAFDPLVPVTMVDPHVWTASLGKAKNEERILRRLGPEERAALEQGCAGAPAYRRKELVDAVGIGLFALKRL